MRFIGTLDLLALAASAVALAGLLLRGRRLLRTDAMVLLGGALLLTVLRNVSNCLEWLGGMSGLEPWEDYIDAFCPLLWGFFFYAFIQVVTRKRLRRSEERNRILLASLPQRIFYKDAGSAFVMVNHAFAADLGVGPEDVVGKTDGDFYPPELARKYRADDRRIMESGQPETLVETNVADGTERVVEVTKAPVVNDEGQTVGLFGMFADVTQRKRTEEALRESERFLASIFSSIQDGVSILDPDMNVVRVNPTMEEWYAHKMPVVGKKCYEAYHGRAEPCKVCPSRRTLECGEAGYAVVPKTGPGGQVVGWLDLYSFPLVDTGTGQLKGAIEYVRDITEQKQAQEALEASEERFRLLVENAFDGINICELDPATGKRRLIFCNERFVQMSGHSRGELENADDLNALAPPDMDEAEREENLRCIERGEPYRGTASWRRPDGKENVYEFAAVPIKVGDKYHLIGIDRDVTERQRAREELQYKFELERLITSISSSFINLSHDEIEAGIERAMTSVGTFAGVDRAYVVRLAEDQDTVGQTHQWCAEGVEAQIDALVGERISQRFPWASRALKGSETLHVPRVADLPAEARQEKELWQSIGIQSVLSVPMVAGGRLIGFVGFDMVRSEMQWDEDLIVLLRVVGVVFANALDRQQAEQALRYSEERYRQIFENATDMITLHALEDITFLYVNPATLAILGYAQDELVGKQALQFVHPDDREHVERRFRQAVLTGSGEAEFRFRKSSGDYVWLEATGKVTSDEHGRPVALIISRDITERVQRREELRALSLEDALTKVNNRRGFFHLAEQQLKVANRSGSAMLLFFADVDEMKWINDNLGHKEGDLALIEAANVLREAFRESDIVGRVGGDEFAVLAIEAGEAEAEEIIARLRRRLDARNAQSGRHYELDLSVGIACFDPANPQPLDELMARADALMYEQKRDKQETS
jgi:diguanylate cyclase (GGDEF)-like protein/PAS domain S-box-containing protein